MAESNRPILDRRLKHLIIHDAKNESTDVVPDPDPRRLLTLVMSLSEEKFQAVTQMLSHTPRLTANEVRNILLKEERKQDTVMECPNAPSKQSGTQGQGDKSAGRGKRTGKYCYKCKKNGHDKDRCWFLYPELSRKPRCSACGKIGHGEDRCWGLHPELAPVLVQNQSVEHDSAEEKGKGKEKKDSKVYYSSKMVNQR